MKELSLEDIEFIKILATTDSNVLQSGMNEATKARLDSQIGTILREYFKENTKDGKTRWIEKFEKSGISIEEGKAAIACARRLGLEIS